MFRLRDDDPDYPALVLGNYILGSGALSSRLGDRIRQKEGLSYSVSSSFSASSWDERASLTLTAISNPANSPRVVKAAQEELDRLLHDGLADDELANARKGYLEALRMSRSNDATLATLLSNLRHLDRTMAYEADYEGKIAALTSDEILAALKRHVNPKKLVVVTAGDFNKPEAKEPPAAAP